MNLPYTLASYVGILVLRALDWLADSDGEAAINTHLDISRKERLERVGEDTEGTGMFLTCSYSDGRQ